MWLVIVINYYILWIGHMNKLVRNLRLNWIRGRIFDRRKLIEWPPWQKTSVPENFVLSVSPHNEEAKPSFAPRNGRRCRDVHDVHLHLYLLPMMKLSWFAGLRRTVGVTCKISIIGFIQSLACIIAALHNLLSSTSIKPSTGTIKD